MLQRIYFLYVNFLFPCVTVSTFGVTLGSLGKKKPRTVHLYPVFEQASVFYNGVGLASDLMVLLHELGHCFHYFLGKDVGPYSLQNWTSEVAEGGSMSMEFIGLEKMSEYLDEDKCKRIKEDRLESIIGLFTMTARGDEFQHWLYANPGHTKQMRRDKWLELTRVF